MKSCHNHVVPRLQPTSNTEDILNILFSEELCAFVRCEGDVGGVGEPSECCHAEVVQRVHRLADEAEEVLQIAHHGLLPPTYLEQYLVSKYK